MTTRIAAGFMLLRPLVAASGRLALLGFVIASCWLAPAVAAPQRNQTSTTISFNDLGYGADITLTGSSPRLSLFIPVYPQLHTLRLRLPVRLSPIADGRSSITIDANGGPIATASFAALRRNPVIDVAIPLPQRGASAINIVVRASLFASGDICNAIPTDALWVAVSRDASLLIAEQPLNHAPFIADWLNDYAGQINIVVPANLAQDAQFAATRLGYTLHQSNRWRRTAITWSPLPRSGVRNVIVSEQGGGLAVRGKNLYVASAAIDALNAQLDQLLLSPVLSNVTANAPTQDRRTAGVSLQDLGLPTQTLTGAGDLEFVVPFGLSAFGGTPESLKLDIALNHTPLAGTDRAYVKVLVNRTLVGSYELGRKGGEERFSVPINLSLIGASNDLRIVPTYFYERQSCSANFTQMTVTLLDQTTLRYGNVQHDAVSVGDFFRVASGKVVVLLDGPQSVAGAFSLLDALGTVNSAIRSLEVQRLGDAIPAGFDYAIVIGSPERVSAFHPLVRVESGKFSIADAATKQTVFVGNYSEPFGVLQTSLNGATPTLIATYWKDPGILRTLERTPAAVLAEQSDFVYIFNAEHASYGRTDAKRALRHARVDGLRAVWLPALCVIGALVALVIGVGVRNRKLRPH